MHGCVVLGPLVYTAGQGLHRQGAELLQPAHLGNGELQGGLITQVRGPTAGGLRPSCDDESRTHQAVSSSPVRCRSTKAEGGAAVPPKSLAASIAAGLRKALERMDLKMQNRSSRAAVWVKTARRRIIPVTLATLVLAAAAVGVSPVLRTAAFPLTSAGWTVTARPGA